MEAQSTTTLKMLVSVLAAYVSLAVQAAGDPNQLPPAPDANAVTRAAQPAEANQPLGGPKKEPDAARNGLGWTNTVPWIISGIASCAAVAMLIFHICERRKRLDDTRRSTAAAEQVKDDLQRERTQHVSLDAASHYKGVLRQELGAVRMLGSPDIPSLPVDILDTFVSLKVSTSWRTDKRFDPDRQTTEDDPERELSPQTVIQRAFRQYRMLLIIGDPGSGKTTLLKYYAMCCLSADRYQELGFRKPPLPIYLPLRQIQFIDGAPLPFAENLVRWADKHSLNISKDCFFDWLHSPDALVLLDGLDEVGDLDRRRKVCKWIADVAAGLGKARFVVTSRWTGYRKSDRIEIAFDHLRADIKDFSPRQQAEFLRKWFVAAHVKELRRKGIENGALEQEAREQGARQARAIIDHLADAKNKSVRELAAVPMLLQIIAAIWKERGFRPRTRSDLYEAVIKYLLEYRDSYRDLDPLLPAEEALRVLRPACLWMQEEHQEEVNRQTLHEYMKPTIVTVSSDVQAKEFCENVRDRAGLIADYGDAAYIFRHKSFREYLAGLGLAKECTRDSERIGQAVAYLGEDWWEESLRFFIAQVDDTLFDRFMKVLFTEDKRRDLDQNTQSLLQTLIQEARQKRIDSLVECLDDPHLHDNKKRYIVDCLKTIGSTEAVEAIQQFAETGAAGAAVAAAQEVAAQQRAVAEPAVEAPMPAVVFRDRPESFRDPYELGAEYILIPGGSFTYSVTSKVEEVPDLYFAKYPVTNQRYRRFISYLTGKDAELTRILPLASFSPALLEFAAKDKGFKEYLGAGPGRWAEKLTSRLDQEKRFKGDDQPVVDVSWYAARAYCFWLSRLAEAGASAGEATATYRLPTEVEWEWAAAGRAPDGKLREYPWPAEKGEPNDKLANYGDNVGATTPVGRYPDGATPEGLMDMAGNVWEWCRTPWQKDYRNYKNDPKPSGQVQSRVVRGGAFDDYRDLVRCSSRGYFDPLNRDTFIGFRVCLPPFL